MYLGECMKIFIVTIGSGEILKFRDRLSSLENSLTLASREGLLKSLSEIEEDAVFLFYLTSNFEKQYDLCQVIKSFSDRLKIFVVFKNVSVQELRNYQDQFPLVDSFIEFSISGPSLDFMMESPPPKNVEQDQNREEKFENIEAISKMSQNPISRSMDELFKKYLNAKEDFPEEEIKDEKNVGDDMSDKDQELSLDNLGELEISELNEGQSSDSSQPDQGFELSLDSDLEIQDESSEEVDVAEEDSGIDLDLGDSEFEDGNENEEGYNLSSEENLSEDSDSALDLSDTEENVSDNNSIDEVNLSDSDLGVQLSDSGEDLNLGDENSIDLSFGEEQVEGNISALSTEDELSKLSDESNLPDLPNSDGIDFNISFDADSSSSNVESVAGEGELSEDARRKLMEIDQMMDQDSSQVNINPNIDEDSFAFSLDSNESISSDQKVNDFSSEEVSAQENEIVSENDLSFDSGIVENHEDLDQRAKEVRDTGITTNKRVEASERSNEQGKIHDDLRNISGAYSNELEKIQATLSNLRIDREELLSKIEKLEEEKIISNRTILNIRAELDEKKIELSIIRKKLNEELSFQKDQFRIQQEKCLILEEKNKTLMQEVEKGSQKNKIDLKRIQMREKELEQKLELLKSDSEIQIRNRDLKIIELKRKIDSMEFDMESISEHEKKSLDSKAELENRLDKAIKTLRSAINLLEEEPERSKTLDILKKNIDV